MTQKNASKHFGPLAGKDPRGRKAGLSSGELSLADILARTDAVPGCKCRVWKHYISPEGVPVWRIDGCPRSARRVIYHVLVGPLRPGARLGTTCTTLGCVAPAHLVARTRSEVGKGRVFSENHCHAIRHALRAEAKINAVDVLRIRTSTEPRAVLAQRFGLSVGYVGKIIRLEVWKDAVPTWPPAPALASAPVQPPATVLQPVQKIRKNAAHKPPGAAALAEQQAREASFERAMRLARAMGFVAGCGVEGCAA